MNYGRCFSSLCLRILSIAIPFHVPSHFSSCPFLENFDTPNPTYLLHTVRHLSLYCYLTWSFSLLPQCLRYAEAVLPALEESRSRSGFACSGTVTLCHAANGCRCKWEILSNS